MRVERRVWVPDRIDVAIVNELAALGGRDGVMITRADLACRLDISCGRMESRMAALVRYGYVRRQRHGRGGVRYFVLRDAARSDVHEFKPAAKPKKGGRV